MKTILIYSGGLDSTVLLAQLLRQGHEVKCLGINYGQRHARELIAAEKIAGLYGVEFKVADLTSLTGFLGGSSQTDPTIEVPEGHYAEESMKLTVVPNRNMLMLAVATAWAISSQFDAVAYAAHAGDHAIYPDCRAEFITAMDGAMQLADWRKITLKAPFSKLTKAEIAALGMSLNAPMQYTWSCYKGGEKHCGKCGTCTERIEAFKLAGVPDPTEYE